MQDDEKSKFVFNKTGDVQISPSFSISMAAIRGLKMSFRVPMLAYRGIRFNSTATSAYTEVMSGLKLGLKQAMIKKANLEKNTIRSILADIKNSEINGGAKDEFNLYKVFTKMINQRNQSSAEYLKQQRDDLSEIELNEVKVIDNFKKLLPISSPEEIADHLTQFLTELKAKDPTLQINKVFPLILDDLAKQWNTSPSLIKPLIPKIYKSVFNP